MKHVLLVCHSQTGQLRRCADSLLSSLVASSEVQLEVLVPTPSKPFPFPWGVSDFLDVMPESVLEIPVPMDPIRPQRQQYDLIVLAYQVWYLAPSLPVTAFLSSDAAKVLAGTPVVALCACRNMWHSGWLKLKARLDALGARVLDHVVLVDQGPTWATFVTTPRWMWTGKQGAFGPFPAAGISEDAIAALAPLGVRLRDAVHQGKLDASMLRGSSPAPLTVLRKYVLPEFLASHVFRAWARLIRWAGRGFPGLRRPLEFVFLTWLCSSVLLLLPILVLTAIVVRVGWRGWFNGRVTLLAAPSGGEVT